MEAECCYLIKFYKWCCARNKSKQAARHEENARRLTNLLEAKFANNLSVAKDQEAETKPSFGSLVISKQTQHPLTTERLQDFDREVEAAKQSWAKDLKGADPMALEAIDKILKETRTSMRDDLNSVPKYLTWWPKNYDGKLRMETAVGSFKEQVEEELRKMKDRQGNYRCLYYLLHDLEGVDDGTEKCAGNCGKAGEENGAEFEVSGGEYWAVQSDVLSSGDHWALRSDLESTRSQSPRTSHKKSAELDLSESSGSVISEW